MSIHYLRAALRLIGLLVLSAATACGGCDGATTEPVRDSSIVPDPQMPDMEGADGGNALDMPQEAAVGLDTRPVNESCLAPPRPPMPRAEIALEQAYPDVSLSFPVGMYKAPGEPQHWYVIEQGGRIKRFEDRPDAANAEVVLDLGSRVATGGERGLLGLAFHPDWQTNGQAYIHYSAQPQGQLLTRLSLVERGDDGKLALGSEQILFEYPQPYGNHNGGMIAFGPLDGLLYMALGDGGSGGDPHGHGQDTSTPLGAILRIDVDRADDARDLAYGIPDDNPFADGQEGAPEIFAWGLRNPWRFSFDPHNGRLWVADVGQGEVEEVNIVERGGNYGWNIREGSRCFQGSPDCDRTDLIDPVAEYDHSQGKSITGGHVYHGDAVPSLQGHYLYGDFGSRRLWALGQDPGSGAWLSRVLLDDSGVDVSAFAVDPSSGESFLLSLRGGTIHKIVPRSDAPEPRLDDFPRLLSQTGCVEPADPAQIVAGAVPYDIQVPFWSDGAQKHRHIALPSGGAITMNDDGGWEFPVGTVFVKSFELGGQPIETRLFVRHDDGGWAGYSYRWRADGRDAELVPPGGAVADVGGQLWRYPARGECAQCHNQAAGFVLGFEPVQLARTVHYRATGRRAPQLDTLEHIGMFAPGAGSAPGEPLVPIDDEAAPLAKRARAYLHSNCANCHQPGAIGRGGLDLRFSTPIADTGTCDLPPQTGDLGLNDARIIAPGAPERSVLLERIQRLDHARMPPLSSLAIDTQGVALLRAWIAAGAGCP